MLQAVQEGTIARRLGVGALDPEGAVNVVQIGAQDNYPTGRGDDIRAGTADRLIVDRRRLPTRRPRETLPDALTAGVGDDGAARIRDDDLLPEELGDPPGDRRIALPGGTIAQIDARQPPGELHAHLCLATIRVFFELHAGLLAHVDRRDDHRAEEDRAEREQQADPEAREGLTRPLAHGSSGRHSLVSKRYPTP